MRLSELPKDCKGIVETNTFSGSMRRRMSDLGFSVGSEIECVGESMLNNPRAYLVKGTVVALRNSDACRIYIKVC